MSITTLRNANISDHDTHQYTTNSSNFSIVFVIIVVIVFLILIISVIKWFIKQRRLRELRHRLIPMYTFDPNDEDDWDSELLCQDQNFVVQKSQDYNSVRNVEDNDSSGTRQSLI